MLKLRQYTGVFSYLCPETGQAVSRRGWGNLIKKAKQMRQQSNLSVPISFADLLEHNYCVEHPDKCYDPNEPKAQQAPKLPAKVDYPSLKEQVRSFVGGLTEWIVSGGKRSDFDEVKRRLDICTSCEFWNGGGTFLSFRCKKCGCRLKIKAAMKTMKCPIGKWS